MKSAVLLVASSVLLAAMPAFGQIDLSGEWNNIAFEDQADRRNGPELGDYTGLRGSAGLRV
jgi:hypothetical protein